MNRLEQVVIFCAGVLTASILAGCAGMTGMGLGGDEQSEIRYCGPDGKENWEVDKSKGGYIAGPKWDRLCGKAGITFEKTVDKEYEATKITKVEMYKIVGHFKGQDPKVKKDGRPTRHYIVLVPYQ